jgi:hypothetical protein
MRSSRTKARRLKIVKTYRSLRRPAEVFHEAGKKVTGAQGALLPLLTFFSRRQ